MIYLPTEIGVKGEDSSALTIPGVKEVELGEDPAVKEQPESYKRIYDVEGGKTVAKQVKTRKQVSLDKPSRKPVELSIKKEAVKPVDNKKP